jgi:nucleotide-binding universal stress UspA family protein
MTESLGFFVAIGAVWVAIGVILSIVMGRRGHEGFSWLLLGTILGPLAVVLAVVAGRSDERLEPAPVSVRVPATAGTGPVDVLVGYDGSSESVAAIDAVVGLLGERLGRLTVATVVPYGDLKVPERLATDRLAHLAEGPTGVLPQVEILHGHPSAALGQHAREGGYELIAVGTRGKGFSKAVMGSAASELARDSKVPVLLVGGHPG